MTARAVPARSAAKSAARTIAMLAVAVVCALTWASDAAAQQQEGPKLEPLRVAGEMVLGGYAGIGGFVIGRFVAEGTVGLLGVRHEGTVRKLGFTGGVIGGGLATAGVVYALGNMGDQTGDFDATYLGTGIGFVAALGVAKMILGPEGRPRQGMSTAARWTAANVIALLPAIGATIAFNSTLRYR